VLAWSELGSSSGGWMIGARRPPWEIGGSYRRPPDAAYGRKFLRGYWWARPGADRGVV